MIEQEIYKSRVTGRNWPIYRGVYYDCHVVSIPQVLGQKLFREWMSIVAMPTIRLGWQGMYCRQILDSELKRDNVLFNLFGVTKLPINIDGDPCSIIENEIQKNGYVICRADSFYQPHFHNDYRQNHSPGHKLTIIDFDQDNFTLIDNNGMHSSVMTLDRAEMIDSILSNLYYAYDKEDTFYRLCAPSKTDAKRLRPKIDHAINKAQRTFIETHPDVLKGLAQLLQHLPQILHHAPQIRAYSWLRNLYKTALTIEFCYNAIIETRPVVSHYWEANLACSNEAMFNALGKASIAWKHLKMQCKTAETSGQASAFATRIEKALDNVTKRETELLSLFDAKQHQHWEKNKKIGDLV